LRNGVRSVDGALARDPESQPEQDARVRARVRRRERARSRGATRRRGSRTASPHEGLRGGDLAVLARNGSVPEPV